MLESRTFTEEQAAGYLQINKRALEEERKRGRITPHRIVGDRIRYTLEILNDYMVNHPLNKKHSEEEAIEV